MHVYHMGIVSILAEEQRIAAALTESGHKYGEAIAARCAHVAAGERFYADVMAYQWRLDALDVLLNSTQTAVEGTNGSESERREAALRESLEHIGTQRASALKSLEMRAADYGFTVSSRGIALEVTGISDRLASSSHEHQSALDRYQCRVQETFDEITNTAQEILKVPPGDEGLELLRKVLERRRTFWNKQLEETWDAWQRSTSGLHQSGDCAVDAWMRITALWMQARQCLRQTAARLPILARSVGAVAARGLEAEFLVPLGLSGLNGPGNSEALKLCCGARQAPAEPSREWVTVRVEHLVSMLKLLQDAESLHEVGEQILQGSNLVCGAGEPMLPDPMIAALSAIVMASDMDIAREAAEFAFVATGGRHSARDLLVPWFAVALVEGMCEVAFHGDEARILKMIDVCRRLGGEQLLHAITLARSQAPLHSRRTAVEVAIAGGSWNAVRLLQDARSNELPAPKAKCQAPVGTKVNAAESFLHLLQQGSWGLIDSTHLKQ